MAADKKSFVLYADLMKSIEHLTNEEKGILFNHLLEYVNDMNPILTDRLLITAWKPIELQLKRDLIKFEEVKVKRSYAGKLGGRPKANVIFEKQIETKKANALFDKQTKAKKAVNDNDNVNVNDNVINQNNEKVIIDFINHLGYSDQTKEMVSDWFIHLIRNGKDIKSHQVETFLKTNEQIYGNNYLLFKADIYYSIERGYLGLFRKNLKDAGFDENTGKKIPQYEGDYTPIPYYKNDGN